MILIILLYVQIFLEEDDGRSIVETLILNLANEKNLVGTISGKDWKARSGAMHRPVPQFDGRSVR